MKDLVFEDPSHVVTILNTLCTANSLVTNNNNNNICQIYDNLKTNEITIKNELNYICEVILSIASHLKSANNNNNNKDKVESNNNNNNNYGISEKERKIIIDNLKELQDNKLSYFLIMQMKYYNYVILLSYYY